MADVTSLITQQSDAAQTIFNEARAYFETLQGADSSINVDELLQDSYDAYDVANIGSVSTTLANRPSVNVSTGAIPLVPVFSFSAVDPVAVPDFNFGAPAVNIPDAPSAALPSVPTAPAIVDPDVPTAPVFTLPTAPTLSTITLPEPPSIQTPQFITQAPYDDLVVPTNNFTFAEQIYQSALLDSAKAKLLNDMTNGGYGIEPADEAQLWERGRERETENALVAINEAYRLGAARGFPLPPGEVFVAVQRAEQDLQNKMSTASREIMLKRADLYVENRKFTITEVRGLETVLINLHSSIQERALNTARYTLDASIQIYNAVVARFNARLAKYQADAAIFEAQIRAALSQVEIYRTTMEGKRIELEVQGQQIDNYRARIQAIESIVNIYRTQLDGANVKANIERIRIDAFRGLIDAFSAQVQAKVAEFNLFRARIDGELSKVQIFEAQTRAYESQVNGARAKSDVKLGNLRVETEQAQQKLAAYNATLEGFKTNLNAQLESGRLTVDMYNADNRAIESLSQGQKAELEVRLAAVNQTRLQNIELFRVAIANAQAKSQAAISQASLEQGFTQFLGSQYTAQLQAAFGAINALAVQTKEDA